MKRASYRLAVRWIAENDESAETDTAVIKELPSVLLVADLFDVGNDRVAYDVLRQRTKPERVR